MTDIALPMSFSPVRQQRLDFKTDQIKFVSYIGQSCLKLIKLLLKNNSILHSISCMQKQLFWATSILHRAKAKLVSIWECRQVIWQVTVCLLCFFSPYALCILTMSPTCLKYWEHAPSWAWFCSLSITHLLLLLNMCAHSPHLKITYPTMNRENHNHTEKLLILFVCNFNLRY